MGLRSATLLLLLDITVVWGQQASTSPQPALPPSMVPPGPPGQVIIPSIGTVSVSWLFDHSMYEQPEGLKHDTPRIWGSLAEGATNATNHAYVSSSKAGSLVDNDSESGNGSDLVNISFGGSSSASFSLEWLRKNAPSSPAVCSGGAATQPMYLSVPSVGWLESQVPWPPRIFMEPADDELVSSTSRVVAQQQHTLESMDAAKATAKPDGSFGGVTAEWRLELYRKLRKYGAVLVHHSGGHSGITLSLEHDADSQARTFEKIFGASLFDSDYGKAWLTQGYGVADEDLPKQDRSMSWLADRIEAKASKRLEQHTDSSFWSTPGSVQMFHMVRPSDTGGETTLVDGIAVAEALQREDPGGYDALCTHRVVFKYKPAGHPDYHLSSATVLRRDPVSRRIIQVRWSNKDRSVQPAPAEGGADVQGTETWYRAYRRFAALMDDPAYRVRIPLKPGTILVFDNWRIAHGRESFVGHRSLWGGYFLRDSWDSKQRLLEDAELSGGLQKYDDAPPDIRTMANTLQEGTRGEFQAQAPLWAGLVKPGALTERVLALLRSMDGEHTRFGFQVNGYEHSLQTATLAHRDGEPEEDVVVALLHDVGEAVFAANHGEIVAAMLRPYVSERAYFVLKYHDLFQGHHYSHHFDLDRNARDALKVSPHYTACKRFTDKYDQAAFDPHYDWLPLSFFKPMVQRLFERTPYSLTPGNPKNTVS